MSDIVRPETRRSRFEAPHKRRPPRTQASSFLIVCGLVAMIWALPYALERLGAMQELVDGWSETAAPVAATVPHWIDVIDGDTVRAGGEVYRLVGFIGGNAGLQFRPAVRGTQRRRPRCRRGSDRRGASRTLCLPRHLLPQAQGLVRGVGGRTP